MIGLVKRYMWGPIVEAMEARQKRIEDGLAAASQGKQAQENAQIEAKEIIEMAKHEAQEIVQKTNQRCKAIEMEATEKAQEKAALIVANAEKELEQQVLLASESLRKNIGNLIVSGVKQVIDKEIDQTTHQHVIDNLIKDLK